MTITGNPIWADPRYLEAVSLFDAWDWGWGMPSDPHARENLRDACGHLAAAGNEEGRERAADFLEVVLTRYFGGKYQGTIRGEIQRIARSAARKGPRRGPPIPTFREWRRDNSGTLADYKNAYLKEGDKS